MRFNTLTAAAVAALSASLLGTVAGHHKHRRDCFASSDADFDYQVEAATDFTIYWTVDTDEKEIAFKAVYEGEGWISVGFSDTGRMVVSDAVIGLPDEATALEYFLETKHLSGTTEAPTQEISGASVTQADSTTTLLFTRPLAPFDAEKETLSAEEADEATFIWAYGKDNTLDTHSHEGRGSVTLVDLSCGTTLTVDDSDSADVEAASTELCASSDPDYEFEVTPRFDLALLWAVTDGGNSVKVKAVYEGEGWLSIGFSDTGRMKGSDAVIGLPEDDTVLEYDMDSYNRPIEALEQEISDATVTQVDGVTTLTFVRPLQPNGDGKQLLSATGESVWIYAWGRSNSFVEHVVDGHVTLTLDSCDVQTSNLDVTELQYAHAWLMVIGWTVCFPVGVIFARFSHSFAEFGFFAHRGLQTLGALFAIAGFFAAVSFTEKSGSEHFDSPHGLLGVILTVFLMLQVVAAVSRPSNQPSGAPIAQQPDDQAAPKPAPASMVRRAWSLSHKALGYIAIIVAGIQCFGGFELLDVEEEWRMFYMASVAALVVTFLFLQLIAWRKPMDIHYVGVELSGSQVHPTTGTSYE